ncbi:17504_t:CDS:1 [Acaulospora morrowiae]|uniref:17504_t:CDS:1 n=1 Tax=Acaulospora morrowiae TaxID=94023 RepID=A0A9N9BVT7_9GLOM|nr:17504_t:CDS:1 [Acaulospora morrowiae]
MSSSPTQAPGPGQNPLYKSAPDLAPSIVFLVLFALVSVVFAYRSIVTRRQPYYYLLAFTLLRTASYIARAIWSQDKGSIADAIASGVISSGGFFLAAQSLFVLFTLWIESLYGGPDNVPTLERKCLKIVKLLLPLSSIIGIVGSVKQFNASSPSDYDVGTALRKASILGFTIILASLIALTIMFAVKMKGKGHDKIPVVLIICTGSLLLLIEMIYRLDSIWSNPGDGVNTNKWVFYVFMSVPEFLFSVFMGVLNLVKIFYGVNDNEKGGNI